MIACILAWLDRRIDARIHTALDASRACDSSTREVVDGVLRRINRQPKGTLAGRCGTAVEK
jgi:hypothetical protein